MTSLVDSHSPESLSASPAGTELASTLRSAAARAAELGEEGVALLFAATPGSSSSSLLPGLRAAAGFASPDAARAAAEAVAARVEEALDSADPVTLDAAGTVGAAVTSLWMMPLAWEDRVHGALVVGSAAPPPAQTERNLRALAHSVALRLDHAWVSQRANELEAAMNDREFSGDEKSDEILKLSEALFAQDIELLRNNEKLGKIEKLKNDFIEKMSRELRTPLNAIIEAVISVLAGENEVLSDGAKAGLRQALDDGTSFLRTLQNILDLWRIKQAELPVEIQEVNFREVVEEAIFSVQDSLEGKDLEIHREVEEPLPKLRTDLAKVNQILFLLLDNAVKYTPRGSVTIRVRVAAEQLVCEIEDTGIGICPDDRQFIFDEFHQVDEFSSTKYRGSGLGLALVKDLLILLGGEVEVESEVGHGSTFRFALPVQIVR